MARSAPPKPTVAFLVRHGQTSTTGKVLPGRAKGLHLSETGRAQAEAVAARLAGVSSIGGLYVSPLERTRETAAPIAAAVGQRAAVRRGLLECDFGEWTGKRLTTLMKSPSWSTVQNSPSRFRFPGGESFAEMQSRIVAQLDALAAEHRGESFVAVSHADPIKAALAHYAGTHLDLFQRLVVSTCSVSAVVLGDRPIVLAINSTGDDLAELGLS